MMRDSELHFLVALRTHINMSKALQVVLCSVLVAVVVQARPGYLGYPYGAAVNPYAAVPYAAAAHPVPVHDTPEVAAAKAAHFAAYNVAAAAAAAAPDHGAYAGAYDNGAYAGAYGSPHGHYVGPLAGVPVIVNGVPADTPAVAAAKAAHFAAYSQAAHGGHHYG